MLAIQIFVGLILWTLVMFAIPMTGRFWRWYIKKIYSNLFCAMEDYDDYLNTEKDSNKEELD